jgi:DNA-binding HxlR family transcriptional regulator
MQDPAHAPELCAAYQRAVELIGRRWTGAILFVLRGGARRFGDLAAAVPGLTDRMLAERLKELEAERIVTRTVIPEMPVRVEYQLTERGLALWPILDAIASWAQEWLSTDPAPRSTPPLGRASSLEAAGSAERRGTPAQRSRPAAKTSS